MKMPEKIFVMGGGYKRKEFLLAVQDEKQVFEPTEYRRKDLPKEVDFDKIRQWDFYECVDCKAMHQEELTTCDCHATGVSKYTKRTMVDLNDLVALGVIKDKGA